MVRHLRSAVTARGVALSLAAVSALALSACNDKNEYVPPPPPKVTVANPIQHPVTNYMELTGNTAAINQVDLEARVQGFLEAINYVDGARAKKGDVLFGIQKDTYQAQLDLANADLATAQADQENKQLEFNRQNTLVQQQVASVAKADDARAALHKAMGQTDAAKANVEIAQINLGYTDIKAPFDGVVSNHLADIGALVGYTGPTKLATIVQLDPIYTYFTVNERQVLRINEELAKRGRPVRDLHDIPVEIGLAIEDGYPHKGTIDYIAPALDQNTGTLSVRGIFDNKNFGILPGLFARVRVPLGAPQDAILVDDTAIATSQVGSYVLVVGKDNKVEQRVVQTGQLEGQLRVVTAGLTVDDLVIIGGNQRAIPGDTVDPQKGDMQPLPTVSPPAAAPAPAKS
jgi:RND family efflux transporter MFP subunit